MIVVRAYCAYCALCVLCVLWALRALWLLWLLVIEYRLLIRINSHATTIDYGFIVDVHINRLMSLLWLRVLSIYIGRLRLTIFMSQMVKLLLQSHFRHQPLQPNTTTERNLLKYIQGVASIEPKKIELIASSAGRMPFLKKWHSPCGFFHKMHFFSRSRMPYSKRNYKTRHVWRHYKTQICHFLRRLSHSTIKIGISCNQFYDFFSAVTGWHFKNTTKQGIWGSDLKHKFANLYKNHPKTL